MSSYEELEKRFLLRSKLVDGHRLWQGCVNQKTGHGLVSIENKLVYLHRYMFCLKNNINYYNSNILVCHIRECDIPSCWAIEHLYAGTSSSNAKDTVALKTHKESKKTHCIKGHEFTPENTKYLLRSRKDRRWRRICITCRKEFDRNRR